MTAALSVPLWLSLGFQSDVWGFIGLVVCGFAVRRRPAVRAALGAAGGRPRQEPLAGLGRAFTGSRTRTAAYLVHLGMVLVVAGLLGSNVYKAEKVVRGLRVKPDVTASVNGLHAYLQVDGRRAPAPQGSVRSVAHIRRLQGRRPARHARAAHRRLPS